MAVRKADEPGKFNMRMPEPHFTVPETEEYHLVSRGALMQLKKGRRDVVFEMFLAGLGAAIAAVVPAATSLYQWAAKKEFGFIDLVNVMMLVAAATMALVCWRIAHRKGSEFEETMSEILKGRRCDRAGNIIPLRPASESDGD